MDAFERIVRDCAKNNSTRVIENASAEHALVLIRTLFETAVRHREEVRVVSGRLLKSFYGELAKTARLALDRGVRFSVLVLNGKQLEGNEFADVMKEHANGSLAVLKRGDESLPHFVVVGDRRFRVEVDDELKIALASFNNDIIPPMLKDIHNRLTEEADAVT